MTKNFNSFWAEFQVLASELIYNKAILISELKFKLSLLLSWAMVGGMSRPTDIYEYAKQCQQTYQDLKDIKIQMPVANFARNRYNQEMNANTNTNTSTKIVGQQANCNKHPANSVYSHPSFVASNPAATRPARSKTTRLTCEKIAKLQREDYCFTCKEVGNHQSKCPNGWRLMLIFTNADSALARVNVSKVTVPQSGHIEAENKWLSQKLLWVVRNHYWSLPLVYQAIFLPMRPSWLHVA